MSQRYDAIVIGAGLAGLSAAALLAGEAGKRVLVLENQDYVGGRLVSFSGEGDRLMLQGKDLDADAFKKTLASVYAWVARSEPDLDTLFSEKMLDGYSFEAGGHATFWGTRGRVGCLLDYLNESIPLPGNEGFSVLDPEDASLHPMEKGGRYGWMSEASNRTAKKLLREMAMADEETMSQWDRISFGKWLDERTDDRKVYEFLAAVASIHMVMGEPDMIPAGDFIRFMRTAVSIGMNLINGSTGIVPKPGFVTIGERLAENVKRHGGTIINGAGVKEILFDGKRVRGVMADGPDGLQRFDADQVVCTVPIRKIFNFLPRTRLPQALVKQVDELFFSVGMLTGYIAVRSNLFADAGIHPKSWLLVPSIIKAKEGFIGDVDIISIMPSSFEPSLAPEGRHVIAYSIALTEDELRDRTKVNRVIDLGREIFHKTFPKMKADTIWEIWTCSDKGFGDWPPPGSRRPDTTQPGLEGLFFAGDGYGAKTWGSGMDAAIHSALQCVDAMTGGNFVEKVLPDYHR
ncbi:MAG: FAD-dependent oxidoreductase [Desulfobacterales bacterium]|nr:FAD-dependent oxidoreductase [Desulfobacterales bacterium]